MGDLEDYLNRIMEAADLAPRDARRVRAELNEHLREIVEMGKRNGVPDEEVTAMTEQEFGNPEELGKAIARAKGKFLTGLKKRSRVLPSIIVALLILHLTVHRFAYETRRASSDAVSPLVQKGNTVWVNKLAASFQENDVVLYGDGDHFRLGIVKDTDIEKQRVVISRRGEEDRALDRAAIVGRVFLQTR